MRGPRPGVRAGIQRAVVKRPAERAFLSVGAGRGGCEEFADGGPSERAVVHGNSRLVVESAVADRAVFADECELVPVAVARGCAEGRQKPDVPGGGIAAREEIRELPVFPFQLAVVGGVTVHAAGTGPRERAVRFAAFGRGFQDLQQFGACERLRVADDPGADRFPGQGARDETDLAVREPADAVAPERDTRNRNGKCPGTFIHLIRRLFASGQSPMCKIFGGYLWVATLQIFLHRLFVHLLKIHPA